MAIYALINNGMVTNTIVADAATIALFEQYGFFPPSQVEIDITNLSPQPGIGWTYDETRDPAFRPQQPYGYVWDDTTDQWVQPPAPAPEGYRWENGQWVEVPRPDETYVWDANLQDWVAPEV